MKSRRIVTAGMVATMGLITLMTGSPLAQAATSAAQGAAAGAYIVQGTSSAAASAAVTDSGGTVLAQLGFIAAVDARLSPAALRALSSNPSVHLTPDVAMQAVGNGYGATSQATQLAEMNLGQTWSSDAGSGVGVALIDTGVTLTPGLTASHLVYSPDFAGDGNVSDGYGHGTFMAGLIAGNGTAGAGAVSGVAPGATLVSVKVAGAAGTTTLGRVLEGISWAVANRIQYNIKVMSISFGADIPVPPAMDPLDAAVEMAWASGITVVAAAGNYGAGQVTSPGDDPWVVTVGAETTTAPVASEAWSGSSDSKPDVFAPGQSVISLRDPGSTVDRANPSAEVGSNYFVGSGTSMATALTAGAAAILVENHHGATPDDIKGALIAASDSPKLSGHAGPINVAQADRATPQQSWWQMHPTTFAISGHDITMMPWTTAAWTTAAWTDQSWS